MCPSILGVAAEVSWVLVEQSSLNIPRLVSGFQHRSNFTGKDGTLIAKVCPSWRLPPLEQRTSDSAAVDARRTK